MRSTPTRRGDGLAPTVAAVAALLAVWVGSAAAVQTPTLDVVLARAADYVEAYQRELRYVVAEERYLQTADGEERRLRSDLLVFSTPDSREPWVAFRDVLEVDGLPVEGREQRLLDLFTESPYVSRALSRRLMAESARYNIGAIQRDLNVPTMALLLLGSRDQERVDFEKEGETVIDGVPVWRIAFTEREPPALIQNDQGSDLFASGAAWIDPQTGRIWRTELTARDRAVHLDVDFGVRYVMDERLGILVPASMNERYTVTFPSAFGRRYGRSRIEVRCLATYTNFRRFAVEVDSNVGPSTR